MFCRLKNVVSLLRAIDTLLSLRPFGNMEKIKGTFASHFVWYRNLSAKCYFNLMLLILKSPPPSINVFALPQITGKLVKVTKHSEKV